MPIRLKVMHKSVVCDSVFFVSSRRLHTICYRDWSSDVCSSERMIRHTRCYRDWSSDVCSSDRMRRHTRCYRDWSSDVCSSDLGRPETSEEEIIAAAQAAQAHEFI